MKKKIYLQDFVDALVRQEVLGKREADIFMRAFFDTIEQGLEQDKFVKIKGLGTFKVVAVGDRESIDVNTGERIQIGGHSKVTFTPDPKMKEMINRPFSHFESVDLDEQMDSAVLDAIDKECGQHQYDTVSSEELTEEATQKDIVNEQEAETVQEAINALQLDTPDSHHPECEAHETSSPQEESKVQPSVESKMENLSHLQGGEEENVGKENPETVAETMEATSVAAAITQTQVHPHFNEQAGTDEGSTIEYTYRETVKPAKRRWWKMFLLVLCQLIIMLVCYFAGYYQILCPCNYSYLESIWNKPVDQAASHQAIVRHVSRPASKPATPEKSDTVRQHQAATSKKREDKVEQDGKQEGESGGQTLQVYAKREPVQKSEKPAYHKVKVGDNLYKISRRYYGTDRMVPYIIKRNNLKDANNITKGMNLYLP